MPGSAGTPTDSLRRQFPGTLVEVAGTEVRVGRLGKLLRSKEASARPKDIEFLRAFQARAFEDDE